MKTGNNQSAPLFVVYGSLTSKNTPSVRSYPLKKAKNRNGAWFYPSEGGTQMVPDVMLGEVDDQTTPGGKAIWKIYFKDESLVDKMVSMMNARMCEIAGKPVVSNLSLPSAVKSSAKVSEAKSELKKVVEDVQPSSTKISVENVSIPAECRQFQGRNLEDYIAVQNILNGYKDEFAVLYKRYYDSILYRYNRNFSFKEPDLCKDLIMEMFERVYERLAQYTPKYTFNAWITKIAENYLIDYCRKAKNHPMVSLDKGFRNGDGGDTDMTMGDLIADDGSNCPEMTLMLSERKEALTLALQKLDEKTRRILIARYFYNTPYSQIIADEGVDLAYAKITVFRAKQKLKKILSKNTQLLAAVSM
jgi:RNA polymerase sigma-70 factor (ECF subfamily)